MIKKCPVCGKNFKTTNAVKFCSNTCRRRHQIAYNIAKRKGNETICWTCDNACSGCSWSRSLIPVEGWSAKKIKIRGNLYTGAILDSYIVKECPEYIPDKREIK